MTGLVPDGDVKLDFQEKLEINSTRSTITVLHLKSILNSSSFLLLLY